MKLTSMRLTSLKLPAWGSNATVRFLLIANALILGSLALWGIFGYGTAARQEAEVQQALDDFARQYPARSANASALKLEQLRAKLGLNTLISDYKSQNPIPPDPAAAKAYTAVRQSISDYVKAQITQPSDRIALPPAPIRRYLAQHQADIAAIQTHLLTQSAPQWDFFDVQKIDSSTALPSFLNLMNLHNVLLLNALENQRLGRSPEAFEGLAASVKLNQALGQRPDLISQLVAIIAARVQSGVLRKLDRLPANWQQRLAAPDSHTAFLNAQRLEAFMNFKTIRDYPDQKWVQTMQEFSQEVGNATEITVSPLAKILQPVQQPYFTLSATDTWQQTMQVYQTLPPPNICRFDADAAARTVEQSLAWWNVLGRQGSGSFLSQWYKVGKREIHWELSQKVALVKQIILTTRQVPQTVPGLAASAVCPELRWSYQVTPNGAASITLANPPQWLTQSQNQNPDNLPLSYQVNGQELLKVQPQVPSERPVARPVAKPAGT